MEYYIQHHMFPYVPSCMLPTLQEMIKDQMPPARKGLWDDYKDILAAVTNNPEILTIKLTLTVPG